MKTILRWLLLAAVMVRVAWDWLLHHRTDREDCERSKAYWRGVADGKRITEENNRDLKRIREAHKLQQWW